MAMPRPVRNGNFERKPVTQCAFAANFLRGLLSAPVPPTLVCERLCNSLQAVAGEAGHVAENPRMPQRFSTLVVQTLVCECPVQQPSGCFLLPKSARRQRFLALVVPELCTCYSILEQLA